MKSTDHKLSVILLMGALLVGLIGSAVGQEKEKKSPPNLSGTLTATATSVAIGVGWSWGEGTLTLLNGSQHHFKMSGLDVVAVGMKQASVVGKVYNLKKIEDFEGTYSKATAGISVGGGAAASTMQNQHGVVINLTGTGQGIDVRLAASGMKITLMK